MSQFNEFETIGILGTTIGCRDGLITIREHCFGNSIEIFRPDIAHMIGNSISLALDNHRKTKIAKRLITAVDDEHLRELQEYTTQEAENRAVSQKLL